MVPRWHLTASCLSLGLRSQRARANGFCKCAAAYRGNVYSKLTSCLHKRDARGCQVESRCSECQRDHRYFEAVGSF